VKPAAGAFFDVDGTLIHTTIVHYFLYYKLRTLSPWQARLWYPWFLLKCGAYLAVDQFDRTLLNRIVYRNYAGFGVADVKSAAGECIEAIARARWLAGAREEIDRQRRLGHAIVLVTGSLDFLMEPLAAQIGGACVLATRLEERGGRFTGRLVGFPVIAEEKRRRIQTFAGANGIDLSRSHAYGDSSADLPMLEAVGFAHAVNPDRRLRRLAQRRGWPIHDWPMNGNGAAR
jgi:HAD superfamily hydrolase (TIGR01490 family)